MKRLEIDLAELVGAFEDTLVERRFYLDLETGQVLWISDETRMELERLSEELDDPNSEEPVDFAEALQEYDMPDWEKQALIEADQVDRLYGSRYIAVPEVDSHESYRDMERFILTVQDQALQNRLWQAIEGRGAFRRFKDTLASHYREQKRWYAFKDDRIMGRVLDWLESEGIEPILREPAATEEPGPAKPTDRERMLGHVLAFVRTARDLPGVIRIALIGSLTTEEPDPKDADLLVTVTDEMDLVPLATLGRKLQGRAQAIARGGEVFLADPHGHYLGRTCPWRQCGPGFRISCDALHCGQRLYLHDDTKAIRLADQLVAAPPMELWPQVMARVPVPNDVEQELLRPLRGEQDGE